MWEIMSLGRSYFCSVSRRGLFFCTRFARCSCSSRWVVGVREQVSECEEGEEEERAVRG